MVGDIIDVKDILLFQNDHNKFEDPHQLESVLCRGWAWGWVQNSSQPILEDSLLDLHKSQMISFLLTVEHSADKMGDVVFPIIFLWIFMTVWSCWFKNIVIELFSLLWVCKLGKLFSVVFMNSFFFSSVCWYWLKLTIEIGSPCWILDHLISSWRIWR